MRRLYDDQTLFNVYPECESIVFILRAHMHVYRNNYLYLMQERKKMLTVFFLLTFVNNKLVIVNNTDETKNALKSRRLSQAHLIFARTVLLLEVNPPHFPKQTGSSNNNITAMSRYVHTRDETRVLHRATATLQNMVFIPPCTHIP